MNNLKNKILPSQINLRKKIYRTQALKNPALDNNSRTRSFPDMWFLQKVRRPLVVGL